MVSQTEGIAVLLGNGDGTFQAAKAYAIDSLSGTSQVVVADVNHDGKPDLLTALVCNPGFQDCNHGGAAGVMFGNGDGTFGTLQAYASGGSFATSIAISDLNRDGSLDLVIDNATSTYNRGFVGILLGNGDGTFQAPQIYDEGGFDGGSLTVADLNGDGIPDVIVANECAEDDCYKSTIGVLLGNGDGSFHNVNVIAHTGGYIANAVAAVDVNGDGIPDLIVDNACDNESSCDHGIVAVMLGHGDGSFSQPQLYSTGGVYSLSIAMADVNGDGSPDVFVAEGCNSTCTNGEAAVLLSLSATTTSLVSNLNPSIYGQAVTLTATVKSAGVAATGQVKFIAGTNTLGSATLNSGGQAILTYSKLNAGSFPLKAVYVGDANDSGSTSPVVNQVVKQATSRAAIASFPNPSKQGQTVTFAATITSPTVIPTGSVTFTAGNQVLGTVPLAGGKAKLTTSSLPLGATVIVVAYPGNANIGKSSASVTQKVE